MNDCLFCKIVTGEIASKKVYEDERVYAFKDLNPLAKEHVLFVHKKHSRDVNDLVEHDENQLLDIFQAIQIYSKASKTDSSGFRVVTNVGKNGGQTVFHTHFHLLSGEKLGGFGR